jgi:hypothetical protein
MSGNLSEFLVDLASDPDQMTAFLADPDRVFDAAGLTGEERDAVRSRDAQRLNIALNGGLQMQTGNTNNGMPSTRKAPARRKKPAGGKKKGGTKKGGKKKGGTKKSGGSRKGGRKSGSKKR